MKARRVSGRPAKTAPEPAYLVFDVETVPDGELLRRTKFAGLDLTSVEAVDRAREQALEQSKGKSDFVAASYCYPIAVCVAKVGADFGIQSITCLDSPKYRPREIVEDFWRGLAHYHSVLVTFNGRGFDLPVLELAAFRFGISARGHFDDQFGRRYRFGAAHLDLNEWLSNHGACPIAGGLDLLSKLLGKPGKMTVSGKNIVDMARAGKIREINDYCMFDTLDTYFVFLRTRVMTGELDLEGEHKLVNEAHAWIEKQAEKTPSLKQYLENWGDWSPWV